jgi:cell division protein FtsW
MITVLMIMLYMAGSRMLYLAGLAAVSIPVGVIVIMREGYRMKRLMAFLDPWGDPGNSGFQIIQSFIAFGSGGAFGVGLGNSMQKLFYLPEPHTDFIISVIGEEGGFLWVSIVIVLFAILVFRGFMISFRSSDVFATLLSAGLTTVIALEVSINVAGVMGLIPTKGLALPFLSYGGTSLIMSMASVGILLNISSYCGSHAGKEERLEGGD